MEALLLQHQHRKIAFEFINHPIPTLPEQKQQTDGLKQQLKSDIISFPARLDFSWSYFTTFWRVS